MQITPRFFIITVEMTALIGSEVDIFAEMDGICAIKARNASGAKSHSDIKFLVLDDRIGLGSNAVNAS